jgi:hypothetical protein
MLFGPLTKQLGLDQSGKDDTGLSRWTVMTLQCVDACPRIVCGYNPCGNNCPDSGTVYQQRRGFFITQRQNNDCPRKLFCEDLITQLRKRQAKGDCLIVCLDANEDIYKKSLGKALTGAGGLSMCVCVLVLRL